jgi:hypothetical protein
MEAANRKRWGRRLRDRLVDREGTHNPRLRRYELSNLLLFVDDDLRETALAIGGIEGFLTAALNLLEKEDLESWELTALAGNDDVLDRLEYLGETLVSLRRRMGLIAQTLKG